ncbi:MAG TPA: hypothetical protein VH590_02230 [Ktedonobacterales bacterium]
MDKVYYLDLQTLLEYLQGQSALLITEVNVPGQQGACTGYLFLKNTSIVACLIHTANRVIVREGEAAYQLLKGSAEWRVRIDPDLEQTYWLLKQQDSDLRQASSPLMPAARGIYIPRPLVALDAAVVQSFPAKDRLVLRMVFTLVNGERTAEQIKTQLRLSPEKVDEALRNLRAMGIIA